MLRTISNKFTTHTRYLFQAQEMDDEIKGEGNSVNYKYRMHDPRLGRFFSVDPLAAEYPYFTPYSFSGNKVIAWRELEGLEPVPATSFSKSDNYLVIVVLGYEGVDPPVNKTQHKNNPNASDDRDGLAQLGENIPTYAPDMFVVTFSGSSGHVTPNDINKTIENYKSVNPKGKIITVGHSVGAQNIVEYAEVHQDVKIDLLITLDNVDILDNWVDDDDVWGNVKNSINYYVEGGFGEITDYQTPEKTNGVNISVDFGNMSSKEAHTSIDNTMQKSVRQDVYNFRNGADAPKKANERKKPISVPSATKVQ
jgi:RHS repeat-associated protein